jgi:anti-anti-sigma factor
LAKLAPCGARTHDRLALAQFPAIAARCWLVDLPKAYNKMVAPRHPGDALDQNPSAETHSEEEVMSTTDLQHVELSRLKDVVLIEITTRDFHGPDTARELSAELARVAAQDWAGRLLVDCKKVRFLCSTAFAALVGLVKRCADSGKPLRFCAMAPEIFLGAQIIGLDKLSHIDDSEAAALAAFSQA